MRHALLGLIVSLLLAPCSALAARQGSPNNLPELHKIKTVTLSPSYSCQPGGLGYDGPALFLSDYSRNRNSPDLLFNGACGSPDFFEASTAGDDMALVADLGRGVSLENLTAQSTFNLANLAGAQYETKFGQSARVRRGHTYAVLLNKREIRGLFVFTVTGYEKNKHVDIRYAVKEYQVQTTAEESPGFDWSRGSSEN